MTANRPSFEGCRCTEPHCTGFLRPTETPRVDRADKRWTRVPALCNACSTKFTLSVRTDRYVAASK